MKELENVPDIGDRCRVRGRKETGIVSFIDLENGWTHVDWDEEYRDTDKIWQLHGLELEEAGYDFELAETASPVWGGPRAESPHPPIIPTGFRRIVFRVIRALTGRTPSLR